MAESRRKKTDKSTDGAASAIKLAWMAESRRKKTDRLTGRSTDGAVSIVRKIKDVTRSDARYI